MLRPDLSRRKLFCAVLLALAGLLVLRYCAFGLSYYPQLDDYIQYDNYLSSSSFWDLVQTAGLLVSRPLADLADYFVWGRLFDYMLVGVVLISLSYVLCVGMIWTLLRRYFTVGPMFPVVMTLLPLGMEGLYWMSASTRIVGGMFFGCLAAMAFAHWLDTGRWYWLTAYLPLQLLPFGFYEQCAVLSMTLVLGLALLEVRSKKERCAAALWAPAAMVLYLKFLALMAPYNQHAARSEVLLPNTPYYWDNFLPRVLEQIGEAFGKGGLLTLGKGFVRGTEMLVSDGLWLWLMLAFVGCGLLGWLMYRERGAEKSDSLSIRLLALLAGLLLALAPVTPFLILGNPWFSLRGTVTSFAGIALIVDTLAAWVLCCWRKALPWISAAFALVCLVACLSEVRDYRDTYLADQQIAETVLSTLEKDGAGQDTKVGILNVEPTYLIDQNFYYHEHIHGCTENSWAFAGLLAAKSGIDWPNVTPLPTTPMYQQWNRETNAPDCFDRLYYYDGQQLIQAQLKPDGTESCQVTDKQGNLLGKIWEENGSGYFQPTT